MLSVLYSTVGEVKMHCTKVCKKRTRRFPSRWGSVPSHSASLLGAFVQMVWFRENNLNDRNPRTEKPSGIPLPGNKATAFNFTAGLLYFLHWVLLLQVSQETTDFKHPQEHGYSYCTVFWHAEAENSTGIRQGEKTWHIQ